MVIDEKVQESARRRLAIIEGQLRGLSKMIEEKKYCIDVLTQISAIHEALRGVGKLVVRHHLETCVTDGLQAVSYTHLTLPTSCVQCRSRWGRDE